MRALIWTFGILAIGIGTALLVSPDPTGAVIGGTHSGAFLGILIVIGGITLVATTGLEERVNPYQPKLSKELRTTMEKQGTLSRFLSDYERLCQEFRPPKIHLPDKGEAQMRYEQLTPEQRENLQKLGKSYAHALHNLLEIALRFNQTKTQYAVIGGFGVYGHLGKDRADGTSGFRAGKWRGTEDIDILTKEDNSGVYQNLGLHRIPQERVNTEMIPDGRLHSFIGPNPYHDKDFKVQDRHTIAFSGSTKSRGTRKDESTAVLKDAQEVRLYGVPVNVASREHLIASKQGFRTRRNTLGSFKDAHDTTHLRLLSELERRVA
jgi:hypothetical protein